MTGLDAPEDGEGLMMIGLSNGDLGVFWPEAEAEEASDDDGVYITKGELAGE